MAGQVFTLHLQRMDTSQPWGFRMKGGAQQGTPLMVEECNPKGRAGQAGLATGDYILAICNVPVQNMTHDMAKQEILRAGNDLSMTVQRTEGGPMPVAQPVYYEPQQTQQPVGPRVQVVEEPQQRLGGPTYKDVQTKTMSHLEQELPAAETGALPAGARPASIFDRKRQERSEYLKAKGPTIQKAFGQRK